jgi:hypothetical protein
VIIAATRCSLIITGNYAHSGDGLSFQALMFLLLGAVSAPQCKDVTDSPVLPGTQDDCRGDTGRKETDVKRRQGCQAFLLFGPSKESLLFFFFFFFSKNVF